MAYDGVTQAEKTNKIDLGGSVELTKAELEAFNKLTISVIKPHNGFSWGAL